MCWKHVLYEMCFMKRKGTWNSQLIERAALWLCILWSKEGVSHGSAWAWDRLDVLRMLRHVEPQLLGWFMTIWCRRCVHKLFTYIYIKLYKYVLDHLIPVFGGTEQDPVTSCRSLHRRWMSAPVLQLANGTTTSIGWLDGVRFEFDIVWRTFTHIYIYMYIYIYSWIHTPEMTCFCIILLGKWMISRRKHIRWMAWASLGITHQQPLEVNNDSGAGPVLSLGRIGSYWITWIAAEVVTIDDNWYHVMFLGKL